MSFSKRRQRNKISELKRIIVMKDMDRTQDLLNQSFNTDGFAKEDPMCVADLQSTDTWGESVGDVMKPKNHKHYDHAQEMDDRADELARYNMKDWDNHTI